MMSAAAAMPKSPNSSAGKSFVAAQSERRMGLTATARMAPPSRSSTIESPTVAPPIKSDMSSMQIIEIEYAIVPFAGRDSLL